MPTVVVDGVESYYEVHHRADGRVVDPVLVMGGWGTYTGEDFREVPRDVVSGGSGGGRTVLVHDWRGLGRSGDDPDLDPGTRAHARVAAAVADDSGLVTEAGVPLHVVGIVGMGACVAQWLAVDRPDLVRSLAIAGGWARADRVFTDQMLTLRDVFLTDGFPAFQRLSALWCFDPDFYLEHADRVLGPDGAWKHLAGRPETMRRLVEATITHDVLDRLGEVAVPTFVLHAGADLLTGPRLTLPIERAVPGATGELWPDLPHVVAGRGAKTRFSRTLDAFLSETERMA
jgi:pimeloyl-ACP methyl ester carboxylesterase